MCNHIHPPARKPRSNGSATILVALATSIAMGLSQAANPLLETQPELTLDDSPVSGSAIVDIGATGIDLASSASGTWEYRLKGGTTWHVFDPTISFPGDISEGQSFEYDLRYSEPSGAGWYGELVVRTGTSDGSTRYDDLLDDSGATPNSPGCCAGGQCSSATNKCDRATGDGSATVNDGSGTDAGSLFEHIDLPVDPNEPDFEDGALLLYRVRLTASDNAADIGALRYVGLPTMKVLVEDDSPADTNFIYTCTIRQASGFSVDFRIAGGDSLGRPSGVYLHSGSRIELLDAIDGNVVTTPASATHIRQYRQNGGIMIFEKTNGEPVRYITRSGRVTVDPASKVELYESGGHLAQVRTAAGLLDITEISERKYTVKRYLPDQVTGSSPPYATTGAPALTVTVEHPASTVVVEVTREIDGRFTRNNWQYSVGAGYNEWTLTHKVQIESEWQNAWSKTRRDGLHRGHPAILRQWKTPEDSTVFYLGGIYLKDVPWAARAGTSSFANDGSRSVKYFENPANPGSFGKISEKTDSHGSTEEYEYDSAGRMSLRKSEWLDTAASRHEEFSYSPHESGETLAPNDHRPRTTEVKVEAGTITISKTMFSAHTNGTTQEYTEITKRAATPTAGWADAANLVTTRTYYPNNATPAVRRGRLKQVVSPDGSVTTYDYSAGSGFADALTTTSHNQQLSGPVNGRSTRTVTVSDGLGRVREVSRAVYVNTAWEDYQKTIHDYSDGSNGPRGYRYRTRVLDVFNAGNQTIATYTYDWAGGRLMAQTDEKGSETSLGYDLYGRRYQTTREAVDSSGNHPAQPALSTTTSSTTPIRLGSRIGFRDEQTETVSGGLKLVASVSRDGHNRITSRTDENGYTTNFSYQLNGRQTTMTRPDGATEITLRHKDGRLASITGTGVVASYSQYSVDGTSGAITETRRAATIDNDRYVATTTNMLGQQVATTRPARDGATATTTTVSHHYQTGTGMLLRTSSTAGDVPNQLRWENGDRTITRSALSTGTTINLAADRVTQTESTFESSGGKLWQVVTTFVYPNKNNQTPKPVSTRRTLLGGFGTDEIARTEVTNELLSDNTTITSQTLSDGILITTTNHPETTANSVTVTYHGRLSQSSAPGQGTTIYGHDALGRRSSVTHPRTGQATTIYHDHPVGGGFTTLLVKEQIDAATHKTIFAYGEQGSPGAGRVTALTRPNNSVTATSYTARGEIRAIWGAGTYARLYLYNDYGETTEMRTYQSLAHGTEPTVGADPVITRAAATTWIHDPATGLLLSKRDAANKGADYAYDPANRITTRKWFRTDPGESARVETEYTYTPMGQLHEVIFHNTSEATRNLTYTYDRLGRIEEVAQGQATTHEYQYDYADTLALTREILRYDINNDGTVDMVRQLDRHHDPHLRPTGYEFGEENFETAELAAGYGFDTAGRIDRVWHHPASFNSGGIPQGTPAFTYSYRYESAGGLHVGTDDAAVNGVSDSDILFHTAGPVHNARNRYETARNLLKRKENRKNAGQHPWSDYAYEVNEIGQRLELTLGIYPDADGISVTDTIVNWNYNGRDELIEADHGTVANRRAYKYDDIGNRMKTVNGLLAELPTEPNYQANPANEYTKVDGTTLPAGAYDDDGNLDNDGNLEYFWDAENRLVRVREGSDVIARYYYDYRGRRIAKATTTHAPQGAGNHIYFYDGWNLIAEFSADTAWAKEEQELEFSFTWGLDLSQTLQGAGGVGGLLVVEKHSEGNTGEYYPTFDGNGNVSEYISTANNGTRVAHYQYDPFGNQTGESTGTLKDLFPHRFSTKYFDQETGFYYYGYRHYDPVTGRWPSRDPIGEEGGINLYGFVGNDGINAWDVMGLAPGTPYNTYAEAKAAAIADLELAGRASWERGKRALNARNPWFRITPQIRNDWGVYNTRANAGRAKWFIAGAEYFTIHYCDVENDGKHYYTAIRRGRMPTEAEVWEGIIGKLETAEVEAVGAEIPAGAKLEGVGHTHILQLFLSHLETGAIRIFKNGGKLSEEDIDVANSLKVEVYAIAFDGTVDSRMGR